MHKNSTKDMMYLPRPCPSTSGEVEEEAESLSLLRSSAVVVQRADER